MDIIDIRNNASLQSIYVGAGPTKARFFAIGQNPNLASVAFGSVRAVDQLSIDANDRLATVTVDNLETVSSLVITNNPQLSAATFDDVQSFVRVIDGNAE